jgi:hypothetical protein
MICAWTRPDSNRPPPACGAGALPEMSYRPMEPAAGLEPATSALRGRRATCRAALACEPTAGIEPAPAAYKAAARPSCCVGVACPRRDSNAHWRSPRDRASAVGLRGHRELGAQDSNLHELGQSQPGCRLPQPPSSARRCGPRAGISAATKSHRAATKAGRRCSASGPRPSGRGARPAAAGRRRAGGQTPRRGALGRSRTGNAPGLSRRPLPVGIPGQRWGRRIRTHHDPGQDRAACRWPSPHWSGLRGSNPRFRFGRPT